MVALWHPTATEGPPDPPPPAVYPLLHAWHDRFQQLLAETAAVLPPNRQVLVVLDRGFVSPRGWAAVRAQGGPWEQRRITNRDRASRLRPVLHLATVWVLSAGAVAMQTGIPAHAGMTGRGGWWWRYSGVRAVGSVWPAKRLPGLR